MTDVSVKNPNSNILAAVSYLLGFITGIVILLVEKSDEFVRFHAMQSTILFGGLFVINLVLGFIPILGALLGVLIWLGSLVLWIVLMIKAYQGERFRLPVVGEIVEKQLSK